MSFENANSSVAATPLASRDELLALGAGIGAPDDLRALYAEAFRDYGRRALWSRAARARPMIADVLAITESLRVEGGVSGRRLAERIMAACRAALKFQFRVLRLLAAHRNPESYVAGAAPLARAGARFSSDIDMFHDRELALQEAVATDTARLMEEGLTIEWLRRFPTFCTVDVRSGEEGTLLEWAVDSAYRFFPALQDELFGYVLHPADIATNKALAAVGRREPRDIVDLLDIHERYLPLGAVLWAASAKDPGFSPEGLVAYIRRSGRYQQSELDDLRMETPIDAATFRRALMAALDEADAFVRAMPAGMEGLLFLDGAGQPVQPDPGELGRYAAHGGQQRGHWPSSAEISRAMMERYEQRL